MLDTIHVGMSGLIGFSKGLRVIANNAANLNTPGFKSSNLQFADLVHADSGLADSHVQLGQGLGTAGTRLDLRAGDLRQTGNDLDLAIEGDGMFVLRDDEGALRYTRAGQFQFDGSGRLVASAGGGQVMGFDANGQLVAMTLGGSQVIAGTATSTLKLTGNLSSTAASQNVGSLKVYDGVGQEHVLTARFTNTGSTTPNSWKVELLDATTVVGSPDTLFIDGRPAPGQQLIAFTYTPSGRPAQALTLELGADVTSFASGNLSTLALASQDGKAPGQLTKVSFNAKGALVLAYSNGETRDGQRIALARPDAQSNIEDLGGNRFGAVAGEWRLGLAGEGEFGSVRGGSLEASNVDLSREFSELVIMQRGYQASSQVISTANELVQELFNMRSK